MASEANTGKSTSSKKRVAPAAVVQLSLLGSVRAAKRIDRLQVDQLGLGQIVVMLVGGAVLSVAAVSVAVVDRFALSATAARISAVQIGPWTTYVSGQMPMSQLIAVSMLGMLGVAIAAVALEVGATLLLSLNPRRRALAAYRHVRDAAPQPVGPVGITVVIPAHNEECTLPDTLAGLVNQTRPPDRVIIVADNCTDGTTRIALEAHAEVFATVGNTEKKAGALNQALHVLLRGKGPSDAILVVDADTVLHEQFIAIAADALDRDPELAAVGGMFRGGKGGGLLGQFQRNEYLRYSNEVNCRKGRVFVLTGTATMFRADALLDVAAARGIYIPGESGRVYDTASLTEDNELTLALKSLGSEIRSPEKCVVVTEIMPTWGDLWTQRKRWERGALENLSQYGITAATVRYWGQQFGIGYGAVALNSAILLMIITALSVDRWIWYPFWVIVTGVFMVEHVATVWQGGWKAVLLAVPLIPEICYEVFVQAVFVRSLLDITFSSVARWGYSEEVSKP